MFGFRVFIFLRFITPVVAGYREYDVDRICGASIDMTSDNVYGLKLNMHVSNLFSQNSDCNVTLVGRRDQPYLHYFLSEAFLDNCADSKLNVLRGSSSQKLHFISGFCGSSVNSRIGDSFITADDYLRFSLQLGDTVKTGEAYTIIVNAYNVGKDSTCLSCFACENNRYVSSSLRCLGNNPCGDHSDCTEDSLGKDVGFGILGLCILLFMICCGSKKARDGGLHCLGCLLQGCGSTCIWITNCVGDCCHSCRDISAAGIQSSRDCCSSARNSCEQCDLQTCVDCNIIIACKCCYEETVSATPNQAEMTRMVPPIITEPEPTAPPPTYGEAVGIAPGSIAHTLNKSNSDTLPEYETVMAESSCIYKSTPV